ncbi:MAG: hypothetical protein RL757_400, partial [Bacteroidota bacterium]
IFDISGKSFGTFVTNSGMLDVHFLVEGTYLLRIKCGDNSTKTLKFVKI